MTHRMSAPEEPDLDHGSAWGREPLGVPPYDPKLRVDLSSAQATVRVHADVRTPMAARLRASRRSARGRLPASQWDGPCSITDAISQYGWWGSPVIAS